MNVVAQQFGVHRTTIERLKRRKERTGSVKDFERSGRPRVTTAAEDRAIRTSHLRRRFQTAAETARRWVGGPDLNPIENLWGIMGTNIRARDNPPTNVQEMQDALREEWAAIPLQLIRRLILSMRRRRRIIDNIDS